MGVIFGKKIGPYRPDLERVSRLGQLFFNIFKLVLNLVESFDHHPFSSVERRHPQRCFGRHYRRCSDGSCLASGRMVGNV